LNDGIPSHARTQICCYNIWAMNRNVFERLVAEALDTLPEFFREKLDNVEIVVEDWPDRETMRLAGVDRPANLLGFYHGVPLTMRTHNYGLVLPDKISIYQYPIEMRCRTNEQVRAMIHRVLRHEVAHYFGIDDERLWEIGAY
jgi:predicted Zn-dependent protease with MMP-like domain